MTLTAPDVKNWPKDIAKHCRVGIITSRFNASITQKLKQLCTDALKKHGLQESNLTMVDVPGALELPFAAALLAHETAVDGIIALGCVLRGETAHFDIVCHESARGLMDIQLACQLPILNGILTVDTVEQANARIEQKATDAATGVIEMILWQQSLQKESSHLSLP